LSKSKVRTILVRKETENNIIVRQRKLFQVKAKCCWTSETSGKHMDRKQLSLRAVCYWNYRG